MSLKGGSKVVRIDYGGKQSQSENCPIWELRDPLLKNNPGSVLAKVLSTEPDFITPQQFLARLPIWISLAKLEEEGLIDSNSLRVQIKPELNQGESD